MNLNKNINRCLGLAAISSLLMLGCQKMDKPGFGDYIPDSNPPGGPLNFYLAFDGTTANPAMNAVDSIRATFPADNPLASVDGVKGKAVMGESKKYIKFARPNDWAVKAQSFSISFWIKRNGQTKNNLNENGPEHIVSFASSNGTWSKSNGFLLLEGNNTACAVKLFLVNKDKQDGWLTWEGGNSIAGLLDNQWHHLAFSYDAGTKKVTFYKDGVVNAVTPTWGHSGNINIDNAAITELRIGVGPGTDYNSGDWLSSTYKGALDQFRLYSKALTAGEVQALFTNKM
jgi:hypothetical protein